MVPVHYDIVPGLEFVEDSLAYYEKKLFRRHIIRLPHPSFYRLLNSGTFVDLGRLEVIVAAQIPEIDYKQVNEWALEQDGVKLEPLMSAVGVRAADSPMRRSSLNKYGPIRVKSQAWYPVWDWNKQRLIDEIRGAGLSLPVDYWLWGRSFDGLDARFIVPLKKHCPRDYKRILEFFPLIEAEIMRYEKHIA